MLPAISLRARFVFCGELSERTANFSKFLSRGIYREYKKLAFTNNSTVAIGRNPICYEEKTELASKSRLANSIFLHIFISFTPYARHLYHRTYAISR